MVDMRLTGSKTMLFFTDAPGGLNGNDDFDIG